MDAVGGGATVEIPHELVHAKAHEMWHRTAAGSPSRASTRSVPRVQRQDRGGARTESEPEAETALKREAVLAAIVEAEGIEVTDDEVDEALRAAARPDASDKQLKRALKRARAQGADEALREDIAMRKAVDLIVETPGQPVEKAAAREKLWTPDKERRRAGLGRDLDPRLLAVRVAEGSALAGRTERQGQAERRRMR